MHVLVLGAGAIGSLVGARLSRTEADVTLLSTDKEHIRAVRENGLVVEELDGSMGRYALPAYVTPEAIPDAADLVLVTVKSHDTEVAVASVQARCHRSTLFLTLQNGIGNWERIAHAVGTGSVLAGVTAQGATLVEPGRIRHGGNGSTFIGEPGGPPSIRVESLVDLFLRAGMDTHSSSVMPRLIWEKLMVNVGINAITAIASILNGMIATLSAARDLSRAAVEEAMLVAEAEGYRIDEGMVDRVLSVARATAVNRSSMGQDVDNRKRTEIDAINGAIVRLGEQHHIPTPVNRTLAQLIKIIEAGYLQGGDASS
jgi:2-dehydropantoate 2-reductase